MDSNSFSLIAVIALFFALYPNDCVNLVSYCGLKLKMYGLNYILLCQAWLMYRKISRDLTRLGMAPPPFKFTHIWERQ